MPPERTPTSELPLKPDVLLTLLALADAPLHGYAVMQRIEEESGGRTVLQAGAFYRTLRNMLEDGLIVECDAPASAATDARTRRHYQVTRLGRATARAELDRMAALVRLGRARYLTGKVKP
jgi:DNA-binding PadR family transcriptional regulator